MVITLEHLKCIMTSQNAAFKEKKVNFKLKLVLVYFVITFKIKSIVTGTSSEPLK